MKRPGGTFRLPKQAAKWTIYEIQRWCREQLCGAPPAKPVDPQTGIELKWIDVKYHAGRDVQLSSNFKGLVINGEFVMAHNGPMTAARSTTRKKKSDSILDNISDPKIITTLEDNASRFWGEIDQLVSWYNIQDMQGCHTVEKMWLAGKEMQQIQENANTDLDFDYVTEVNLYYSIEERGIGHPKRGYGKRQLYGCLEIYKWLRNTNLDHSIMAHRTNPIMKLIMMVGADRTRRMNLFMAYDSGPLEGFTDDQFGWALGMSENTFPTPDRWNDLQSLCEKIACGENLSEEELVDLQSILNEQ